MRITFLLIFLSFINIVQAQSADDIINTNHINITLVEELLLKEINQLRNTKLLSSLTHDNILAKAADEQAAYCSRKNEANDFQEGHDKHSVTDRVRFYKGNSTVVGENCLMVSAFHQSSNEQQGKQGKVCTYEQLAHQIFKRWKSNPDCYKNILKNSYIKTALSLSPDKNKTSFYTVQVFASDTFTKPVSSHAAANKAYGISESDPSLCRSYGRNEFLTQVLSSYLKVQGDSVFLYYPLKKTIDTMITGPRDGVALDLVCKTQFTCNGPNHLDPDPVYDGYMLPPVYREDLFKNNRYKDGQFMSFVGKIPPDAPEPQMQMNLILIQDDRACRYSFPLTIERGKLPDIPIDPMWCKKTGIIKKDKVSFTRQFSIPFMKNDKTTDSFYFEKLSRLAKIFDEAITKIEINAYSSVEGTKAYNIELQTARAQFIENFITEHLQQKTTFIKREFENWDLFRRQIKGTSYEKEFPDSSDRVRALINKKKNDPRFENMLDEQRIASIKIYVDKSYDDEVTANFLPLVLYNGITKGDTAQAQIAYSRMIDAYEHGDIDKYFLTAIEVPLQRKNLPLVSNYLASILLESDVFNYISFSQRYYEYIDSAKRMFSSFKPLAFNLAVYKTHLYLRSLADDTTDFKKEEAEILAFHDDPTIDAELSNHLLYNYYLTGSLYYEKLRLFDHAHKAFEKVKPLLGLANLQPHEVYEIGKYFNRFNKLGETIDLLEKYLDKYPDDEDMTYLYVSTGSVYNLLLHHHLEIYYKQIDRLAGMDKPRLCRYFNVNYQLTRSDFLKEKFCSYCSLNYW